MKTLLIVPVHSYVDLITNSSSELFIASGSKSVEAVKDILFRLVEIHQEKEELMGNPKRDTHELFNEFFGRIEECPYNFDADECPCYEEYRAVHDYDDSRDHPICRECRDEWNEHVSKGSLYDSKDYQRIWKKWNDLQRAKRMKVLRWAFKHNKLEWDYDPKESSYDADSSFWKKANWFTNAMDWSYTLTKGHILIESNGDNSIPYNMFDDIEHVLSAHRRHLG